MEYIDRARIEQIDPVEFHNRHPFPWVNLQGLLTEEGFQQLYETLPPIELFERQFDRARAFGQASHDRYALQYRPGLQLTTPWREFIAELHGERYENFLRRMFDLPRRQRYELTMHWHYATRGGAVSPHCDARRKLGSHLFYFNTEADWDPRWGGQTLVLDDGGRLRPHSAPALDELRQVAASEILGNRSFLFRRTEHSWHGVRSLVCPPDRWRKIFIVVINRLTLQVRLRHLRGKDADGYPRIGEGM